MWDQKMIWHNMGVSRCGDDRIGGEPMMDLGPEYSALKDYYGTLVGNIRVSDMFGGWIMTPITVLVYPESSCLVSHQPCTHLVLCLHVIAWFVIV